jgi:hypothetical protein
LTLAVKWKLAGYEGRVCASRVCGVESFDHPTDFHAAIGRNIESPGCLHPGGAESIRR